MRAEELVGHYAVRTSPVILSEDEKIMDDCFMDKPGFIVKYNLTTDSIVIDDHNGNTVILDNDYNDDNWVSVDENPMVTKPAGYRSITFIYQQIEKKQKEKQKREEERKSGKRPDVHTGLDIMDCLMVLSEYMENNDELIFQYDDIYKDICSTGPKKARLYNVGGPYTLKASADTPDIIFNKCDDFSKGVTLLQEHGVDVINTFNVISMAIYARFGYPAINNAARYDKLYIIAASGTYVASKTDMLEVKRADYTDMLPVIFGEDNIKAVILNSRESSDIYQKVSTRSDSSGIYKCNKLDFG